MSPKKKIAVSLRVGVVTLIALLVFVGSTLVWGISNLGSSIMLFVNEGERFAQGVSNGRTGSDGQFAYYIATEGVNSVSKMDTPPALRYQRILYPALAAALTFGHLELVPWTMLIINVAATAILAVLLAYLLAHYTQASPWLALLPALWAGSLICVRFDMNEPLTGCLCLACLLFYCQERIAWASLAGALAGLGKEVALVLVVSIVFHAVLHRHWRTALMLGGAALLPYVGWAWLIRQWLGNGLDTVDATRRPSLIPFYGITGSYSPIFLVFGLLWVVLPAVILGVIAFVRWLKTRSNPPIELWLLAGMVGYISLVPPATFEDLPSTLRYAYLFVIAATFYVARQMVRHHGWLVVVWGPTVVLGILLSFAHT